MSLPPQRPEPQNPFQNMAYLLTFNLTRNKNKWYNAPYTHRHATSLYIHLIYYMIASITIMQA